MIYESARITSRLLLADLGRDVDWLGAAGRGGGAGRGRDGVSRLRSHANQEAAVPNALRNGIAIGVIGGGLGGLAAACTLAARGYAVMLFEKSPWLGGKAAVLERSRLPLRHGADDPDDPVRAAAHLRRSRPEPRRLPRPRPPRPAVALLLRRRRDARPRRRRRCDGGQARHAIAPGSGGRLPQLPRALRTAASASRTSTSSGSRSAASAT